MRTIALHVFDYSLDGIIGAEGTEFYDFCRAIPDDAASEQWLCDYLGRAEVHIVGRVTFEGMAGYFPTAPDDDPFAPIMNKGRKLVFSSTLTSTDWPNAEIVRGDLAGHLDALRREGTGEIVAHGGISFARSLAQLDLVDEYRLLTAPVLAGSGSALFQPTAAPRPLELVSATAFGNGLVGTVYRRHRA